LDLVCLHDHLAPLSAPLFLCAHASCGRSLFVSGDPLPLLLLLVSGFDERGELII